jgi:copper chaperone CopZ
MKVLQLVAVAVLSSLASISYAQNKTEEINVLGNCGMCKKRIEASLKDPAISKAEWNKDTKFLTVTYDSTKLSAEAIQEKIAAVGHDTPKIKAKDEVYAKLPGCCKYDRSGKISKAH